MFRVGIVLHGARSFVDLIPNSKKLEIIPLLLDAPISQSWAFNGSMRLTIALQMLLESSFGVSIA